MRPKSMKDVRAGSEAQLREGSPATQRVRGLRDVMSSRKVAGRSVPATRSQQLSEIAWLDREMERLSREESIMQANLARITARLAEVVDRRDTILGVIRHELGIDEPDVEALQARTARAEADPVEEMRTFSLEY